MTARELPLEEWGRLTGTELETLFPLLTTESARILVVEDSAGSIIGCWAVLHVRHVEGLWISPAYQGFKAGAVARKLVETMKGWLLDEGAEAVVTAATSPVVAGFLDTIGATKLPGQSYVMTVAQLPCR